MKLKLLIVFLCVFSQFGFAQKIEFNSEIDAKISSFPREEIFIHYNASLLFAGEYLYFQVYNRNPKTNLFSKLSKLAYVELRGEEGDSVFQHKINLVKGAGSGDFFIPANVPSGNYKLIGYTKWMKNKPNNFFHADITIINPYWGDQSAFANETDEVRDLEVLNAKKTINNEDFLDFNLNKTTFGKREEVSVRLKNEKPGNYSISVRKLDTLNQPEKITSHNFSEIFKTPGNETKADSIYLPDLRGDLLKGKLNSIINSEENLYNMKVALSIPGDNFDFQVSSTDENGIFYFNIDQTYPVNTAIFQVIGEEKESYSIALEQTSLIDISEVDFNKFSITPQIKDYILQRSVHNQIENAYYEVKPDTLKNPIATDPFFEDDVQLFKLDDYTRFPTLRETFIEIINIGQIRRNTSGEPEFKVRAYENASNFGLPSLLIVDGIMLQDHSEFIDFPADKIESIGIVRDNLFMGPHIFEGAVIVKTFEGNYTENYSEPYLLKTEIEQTQPVKNYFHPVYTSRDSAKTSRIPDFRYQLLWMPTVAIEKEIEVTFFTSDIEGKFEINIEGFTADGDPVTLKKFIEVE